MQGRVLWTPKKNFNFALLVIFLLVFYVIVQFTSYSYTFIR